MAEEYASCYAGYVRQIEQMRRQVEQSQALIRGARELLRHSREIQAELDERWHNHPRPPSPAAESLAAPPPG
jgi:hypothetical protein